MDKNLAVCYRFYNQKSQRLALFCNYADEETVELVIIPCSKQDQFSKKEAFAMYKQLKDGDLVPSAIVLEIPIVPEERTLKTLFRYAFNNLYEFRQIPKISNITQLIKVKHA